MAVSGESGVVADEVAAVADDIAAEIDDDDVVDEHVVALTDDVAELVKVASQETVLQEKHLVVPA